jgi:hypothetical protein
MQLVLLEVQCCAPRIIVICSGIIYGIKRFSNYKKGNGMDCIFFSAPIPLPVIKKQQQKIAQLSYDM